MSPRTQRSENNAVQNGLYSSDGTGHKPLTRDPTWPGRFWPGDQTRSLRVCTLNWEIILTAACC